MPKLKSESIQTPAEMDVNEPLALASVSAKKTRKPRKAGERKSRSKKGSMVSPLPLAEQSKLANNSSHDNDVDAGVESQDANALDFSVNDMAPSISGGIDNGAEDNSEDDSEYETITVPARRQRGHNHQDGVSCEFCKLDDADFTAAYNLLRTTELRRKQQQQAAEIEASQAPVFVADATEETSKFRFSKQTITRIAAVVAVALATLIWQEESAYTRATSLTDLGNKSFITADRDGTLKFLHNAVSMSTGSGTSVVKVRRWQENWRDQLALLFGQKENTLWLKEIPQGFQAQDGSVFYGKDSTEIKVIDSMNAVRDAAERMYQAQGHYPTNTQELESFTAAGSVTVSPVNVREEIGANLITDQGETSFEHSLKSGQKFGLEKEIPNSISCLEVKSEPSISSDFNSYGFKTNAFFIHGFDSKGNLIKGTNGSPVMLLSLKNGRRGHNLPDNTVTRPDKPTAVWVYAGDMPNENSLRFGYLAAAFLIILTLGALFAKRVNDNVMNH